jgi:hypothetical protein
MGEAYKDNQAVLRYELALRRLEVAQKLLQHAPRPIMVNSQAEDGSALSTLLLAQILPDVMAEKGKNGRNGQHLLERIPAPVVRERD